MKIHIIGTVNGRYDEGMRNVATHLAKAFEKEHTVCYSGLKSIPSILRNSIACDATLIFARANKLVYWLSRAVGLLSKNVWLVCVQEPDADFTKLAMSAPLKANYLAIVDRDLENIPVRSGYRKLHLDLGIQGEKFCPVDAEKQKVLKEKYGFGQGKPLVLHVGHCSAGRGLEDFAKITDTQKLVVASGMFEHADTVKTLEENGVRIISGYIENIEEIYQMADVYLFPTRSAEYVISIPLSVMEALSCGVPVVGYQAFQGLAEISAQDGAVTKIGSSRELNAAVHSAARKKCGRSLLKEAKTWEQAAEAILNVIKEG